MKTNSHCLLLFMIVLARSVQSVVRPLLLLLLQRACGGKLNLRTSLATATTPTNFERSPSSNQCSNVLNERVRLRTCQSSVAVQLVRLLLMSVMRSQTDRQLDGQMEIATGRQTVCLYVYVCADQMFDRNCNAGLSSSSDDHYHQRLFTIRRTGG